MAGFIAGLFFGYLLGWERCLKWANARLAEHRAKVADISSQPLPFDYNHVDGVS